MKAENERIEMLAERVKLLFGFCGSLIPEIDLLEKALLGAKGKEDFTMSAAPILGAMGVDYEQKNWEWRMKRERAEALINLIEVLKRTEDERIKMNEKKSNMSEIVRLMGL